MSICQPEAGLRRFLMVLLLTVAAANHARMAFSDDTTKSDKDQTVKVLAAAQALLSSLNEEQTGKVLFKFNDEKQRANWSNLPTGIYQRAGLRMGDLAEDDKKLVFAVIEATLSKQGFQQVLDNVKGDEVLNGGGRRGRVIFGEAEFYFSILGVPSRTEPWMWQFGGHHLAINATVFGDSIVITPSLTGGQPMTYTLDGHKVVQMRDEVEKAFALVNALTPDQRKQAILGDRIGDLLLGPGKDDVKAPEEGIKASAFTVEQKSMLRALVQERIGLLNDEDAAVRMAEIEPHLDEAYFCWKGSTAAGTAAYYRVQGVGFVMEFAPQQMGGNAAEHIHAMYRDPLNDYGAALLKAAK